MLLKTERFQIFFQFIWNISSHDFCFFNIMIPNKNTGALQLRQSISHAALPHLLEICIYFTNRFLHQLLKNNLESATISP